MQPTPKLHTLQSHVYPHPQLHTLRMQRTRVVCRMLLKEAHPVCVIASDVLYCPAALPLLLSAAAAVLRFMIATTRTPGSPGGLATPSNSGRFVLCHVPRCRVTEDDIVRTAAAVGLRPVSSWMSLPADADSERGTTALAAAYRTDVAGTLTSYDPTAWPPPSRPDETPDTGGTAFGSAL